MPIEIRCAKTNALITTSDIESDYALTFNRTSGELKAVVTHSPAYQFRKSLLVAASVSGFIAFGFLLCYFLMPPKIVEVQRGMSDEMTHTMFEAATALRREAGHSELGGDLATYTMWKYFCDKLNSPSSPWSERQRKTLSKTGPIGLRLVEIDIQEYGE